MFESQYTVLLQDSYRRLILIYCCLSKWIYPFSTHDLLFFSFNSNRLWILFELYTSSVLSASGSISTDIKIYTSETLGKQAL